MYVLSALIHVTFVFMYLRCGLIYVACTLAVHLYPYVVRVLNIDPANMLPHAAKGNKCSRLNVPLILNTMI